MKEKAKKNKAPRMRAFTDRIIASMARDGKISIKFIGTFYVLPRKRGKLYGFGEGRENKYTKRIKFKPSVYLKDTLCK